jgi:hypothetical protein
MTAKYSDDPGTGREMNNQKQGRNVEEPRNYKGPGATGGTKKSPARPKLSR